MARIHVSKDPSNQLSIIFAYAPLVLCLTMKTISCQRIEFHGRNKFIEDPLLGFVYDRHYSGAGGIFPPLHNANIIFLGGGGDGGMRPGAIREPFKITKMECLDLVRAVKAIIPRQLKGQTRYLDIQFHFESEEDYIRSRMGRISAVCDKHQEE